MTTDPGCISPADAAAAIAELLQALEEDERRANEQEDQQWKELTDQSPT